MKGLIFPVLMLTNKKFSRVNSFSQSYIDSLSLVMIETNFSLQFFSKSVFPVGILQIAIPLCLDLRETVQPYIEQLSPGISCYPTN